MGEDVNTVSPTLGFIIKTIDYEGYKLNIWDVGGQKTLRSYWRNYFEKTDVLIWVVDATDRLRIEDCRAELHGLLQEERLAGASLLVFANKTDVEGCMTGDEILESLKLKHIRTHQWHVLRCSAMTGEYLGGGAGLGCAGRKGKAFLVLKLGQAPQPPTLERGIYTEPRRSRFMNDSLETRELSTISNVHAAAHAVVRQSDIERIGTHHHT
ncbi:hypothetical protein OPQ81_008063 [Rhizoctonia solani]|nr:hypothetical protein OPQ81_008063 [Rhizoctonia solani]